MTHRSEGDFRRRFAEYAATLDCVHCGLCIPHCPTHGVTGREADSPRGRIYLMRGWAEGRVDLSDTAREHLDQCIVCRACESVCPSGIHMGQMMESFREETREKPTRKERLGRVLLKDLLPSRTRLRWATEGIALYQTLRLDRAVQRLLDRFSPKLARVHALQPRMPARRTRHVETDAVKPEGFPARGTRRARVALFLGCIAADAFAPVHRATIRALQANGCDVVVPDGQTCCGALQRHAGWLEDARHLHERNAKAFDRMDLDAIVVNAAGCGAALKEPLSSEGPRFPVKDIMEFLHELGILPPTSAVARKVAYDQPCHLVHGQGVGESAVRTLLAQIPQLNLVSLRDSERCCGAGGIYNLLHPEMSEPVLHEKVKAIVDSGADTVVTGNPGCALQLAYGLREHSIEVRHPIELLAAAYPAT